MSVPHRPPGAPGVVLLGAGEAGLSALARTFGPRLAPVGGPALPPAPERPLGAGWSAELDAWVESVLRPAARPRPRTVAGQAWLAARRPGRTPAPDDAARAALRGWLGTSGWCLAHPGLAAAWEALERDLPDDAPRVVLFRHPAVQLASLADRAAREPEQRHLERAQLEAHWIDSYRRLCAAADRGGCWHFVEFESLFDPRGRAALEARVGPLDARALQPWIPRGLADAPAPPSAAARALYAELRRRAAAEATPGRVARAAAVGIAEGGPVAVDGGAEATARAARPGVTAVALVGPEPTEDHTPLETVLGRLSRVVDAQRGVEAELLVVDTALEPTLVLPAELVERGVRLVHEPGPSRGSALRRAAAEARHSHLALLEPDVRPRPWHLARATAVLAADPELDAVAFDLAVADDGRYVDRLHVGAGEERLPPAWHATLVGRRTWFADAPTVWFRRAEQRLWLDALEAGRARHLAEPAADVERAAVERRREDARLEAELSALDRTSAAAAPELSVLLCTFRRRDTLVKSLAAFARQRLAPGRFELVLVNDGSDDGTPELLDRAELPVPATVVHRENGGLAAARNTGLEHCRGALTLLVNDDTLPFPDCVEQHLLAHARRPDEKLCVLGTFEQTPRALGNALLRYLEHSWEVFGYSQLEPGGLHDALRFYTCNVSVPTDALRAVGGYDTSFRHYGCEDTDVGLKLERRGYRVLYETRARAHHDDAFGFEYLERRQRLVARAFVRLFRLWPEVRERWPGAPETRVTIARERWPDAELAQVAAAARELSTVDVGALAELGGDYRRAAEAVLDRLAGLVPLLHRQWWLRGLLEGFDEHGVDGLDALLAHRGPRFELPTEAWGRLVAWPRWADPASLDALVERVASLDGDPHTALVLRHDPDRDGPREAALTALETAFGRAAAPAPEIVLLEGPLPDRWAWLRVRREVHALLPLGGEPEPFLAEVDVEHLPDAAAVARWRARITPPADTALPAPAVHTRPRPELSVIVPTHDRPRELAGCLAHLAAQDLDRRRFEVLVVDDESRHPAEDVVARCDLPLDVTVLRQANAGPGVARNRGLERARGECVVFLNDDARPLADCLTAHLRAQAGQRRPHAVTGRFPLAPERRATPFQELIESSTLLFSHPRKVEGVLYDGMSLCTANISLRREVLDRLGGFDHELRYLEDSELGWRLEHELDLRVRHEPAAVALHDHAFDLTGVIARQRTLGCAAAEIALLHDDAGWLDPSLRGRSPRTLAPAEWALFEDEPFEAVLADARRLAALDSPCDDPDRRRALAAAAEGPVTALRLRALARGIRDRLQRATTGVAV